MSQSEPNAPEGASQNGAETNPFHEQVHADIKQEFSRTFYDHGLDTLTNGVDLGFIDFNKSSQRDEPRKTSFADKDRLVKEDQINLFGEGGAASPKKESYGAFNHNSNFFGSQTQIHKNPFSQDSANHTPFKSFKQPAADMFSYPPFENNFMSQGEKEVPHASNNNFMSNQTQQQHQFETTKQYKDFSHINHAEYIDNTFVDDSMAMLWSNDSARATKQKLMSEAEPYGKKRKLNFDSPYQDEGMNYLNSQSQQAAYNESSRGQLISELNKKYPRKKESQEESRKYEGTKVKDEEDGESPSREIQRPGPVLRKQNVNKQSIAKTLQANSVVEEEDKDDGLDSKGRSSRGLRVLSLKVKDIVSEKKKTTYKDVAETLIKELNEKHKQEQQGDPSAKDEQNVKRRVYDALNVLIAADILKKDGKAVTCDENIANIGTHNRKRLKSDKEKLERELHGYQERKKNKMDVLQETVFKLLAIKNLINRNKAQAQNPTSNIPAHIGGAVSKITTGDDDHGDENDELLHFPFIVVVNKSDQYTNMNLNLNQQKTNLGVESEGPLHIYGDIDILLKMKLHYANKQLFKKTVPHEVQQLMPKSYIDQLKSTNPFDGSGGTDF